MFRAAVFLMMLTCVPAVASAQQPCTTDARHVVNELYRHMLERPAGEASAGWVRQLESGRMTVRDVVREIATSPEHLNRFFYTEFGEQTPYYRSVGRFYRHLLGRQPDPGGARSFAQLAQSAGPVRVINGILRSREYEQQLGNWGVPGSGGVYFCPPTQSAGSWNWPERDDWFDNLDANNDNRIQPREWRRSAAAFTRLDVDNDNMLSRAEVLGPEGFGVAPTTGQLLVVDANQAWTDTGITVRRGQTIVFDIDGDIRLSPDPNDVARSPGALSGRRAPDAPLPNAPAGALIGRIDGSGPFGIGNLRSIQAPASGRLYLGINDDYFGDNAGQFRVMIDVR
jgi:hypothetical protein